MLLWLLLVSSSEPTKVKVEVKSADIGVHPTFTVYRGGPLGPVVTSCTVPCVLEVDVGIYYVELHGDGVRTGQCDLHAFRDMEVSVRVGSSRVWVFGVVSVVVGSLLEIAGGSLLAISFSTAPAPDLRLFVPAIGALVLGTAALIAGPIFVARSASQLTFINQLGFAVTPTLGGSTYTLSLRF